jgi:speckle-type POZ protein
MSAVGHGRQSRSATRIEAKQANVFHRLRINGYSQLKKTILPGQKVSSNQYTVGRHTWCVDFYPNGHDASANHNAISIYLQLADRHQHQHLQARYKFSLLDHAGNAAYELPAEDGSFVSVPAVNNYADGAVTQVGPFGGGKEEKTGPGCGYEEFIGKEDLERRDLIHDDSIMILCDVGITEIVNTVLAHEDLNADWEDGEEYYEETRMYGFPPPPHINRRRHPRRADDGEYIKWYLGQGLSGGPPSGYYR